MLSSVHFTPSASAPSPSRTKIFSGDEDWNVALIPPSTKNSAECVSVMSRTFTGPSASRAQLFPLVKRRSPSAGSNEKPASSAGRVSRKGFSGLRVNSQSPGTGRTVFASPSAESRNASPSPCLKEEKASIGYRDRRYAPFTRCRVKRQSTVIDCEKGRWIYLKRPLTDSHNYDKLTVAGVIQKSSNIGTAKVALTLGKERVYEVLKTFGFGEKTGLPFPLESRGYLPRPKRWDGLSITRFPIGYGIRVSPLQLLRAYCALASNGNLPELRLVDRLVDTATGKETKNPPKIIRRTFMNPAAHRQLVDMMITVTEPGGTATKAAIPGYRVAGKTGTSRKYVPGRGYSRGAYFASFVGFVPAYKPRLVMLVTFDNPKGASYGGTIAGPVFSRAASRILKYWNVPPDHIPEKTGKKK